MSQKQDPKNQINKDFTRSKQGLKTSALSKNLMSMPAAAQTRNAIGDTCHQTVNTHINRLQGFELDQEKTDMKTDEFRSGVSQVALPQVTGKSVSAVSPQARPETDQKDTTTNPRRLYSPSSKHNEEKGKHNGKDEQPRGLFDKSAVVIAPKRQMELGTMSSRIRRKRAQKRSVTRINIHDQFLQDDGEKLRGTIDSHTPNQSQYRLTNSGATFKNQRTGKGLTNAMSQRFNVVISHQKKAPSMNFKLRHQKKLLMNKKSESRQLENDLTPNIGKHRDDDYGLHSS